MFFFSRDIAAFVSNNANIPFYLRLFAPLIPIMYVDTAVDSMLKGLNEQMSSMKYNIIDSFLSVMMVWFVLPRTGLPGYIVTIFLSEILNGALSLNRLLHVVQIKFDFRHWVILPILSAILPGICAIFLYGWNESGGIAAIPGIVIYLMIYLSLLVVFRSVTTDDIRWGMSLIFGKKKKQPISTKR